MEKPIFTGVCTALVTPFLNGTINYPMLQLLIRRQISVGVPAIVLAGTTGEAPTLSDSEKIELFIKGKEYAGADCKIIAGTGSNSTAHAVELSIAAQEAGADALLIVSPYYNKANPDGLYAHYEAVALAVEIPIIIYNVPSRTGVDIPISVYKQLSALPNIAGVKEASTDITKQLRTHAICGEAFHIWAGNDDQIVPSLSLGGCGVISVLSNVYPAETITMAETALSGDYRTASALHHRLVGAIDLLFSDVNPIPVKAAMKCIGFDCGTCRLPLTEPTAIIQEKIATYFK